MYPKDVSVIMSSKRGGQFTPKIFCTARTRQAIGAYVDNGLILTRGIWKPFANIEISRLQAAGHRNEYDY